MRTISKNISFWALVHLQHLEIDSKLSPTLLVNSLALSTMVNIQYQHSILIAVNYTRYQVGTYD